MIPVRQEPINTRLILLVIVIIEVQVDLFEQGLMLPSELAKIFNSGSQILYPRHPEQSAKAIGLVDGCWGKVQIL